MTLDPWNNWLLMALFAPMAYAVSCIVDVCCVGERIFRVPSDGPMVSCLFSVIPLGLVVLNVGGWDVVAPYAVVPALLSGVGYFLQIYFYFRALFLENDASNAGVFSSLGVLFVPVLSFLLLGERLAPVTYLAIVIASGGAVILVRGFVSRAAHRSVWMLVTSVLFGSLSMVTDAWVFDHMAYWNGVLLTAGGSFLCAVVVLLARSSGRKRILVTCGRFGWLFLLAEGLHLTGALASQRAVATTPSVSLVALVECSEPLFVMTLGFLLAAAARCRGVAAAGLLTALTLQTASLRAKCGALLLISTAIVMSQVGVL